MPGKKGELTGLRRLADTLLLAVICFGLIGGALWFMLAVLVR